MPRFRLIRTLPAVYQEIYEADAADAEEAERALSGGRAQCKLRQFCTRPNSPQPAAFRTTVLEEGAPPPSNDFPVASGPSGSPPTFNNAYFPHPPGQDLQQVIQVMDA